MEEHDHSVEAQVDLALANAKRVARESRIVVQTLARLRDHLQPEGHKENDERRDSS
jgi:hypothetical protein